jgi:hypothetical protein
MSKSNTFENELLNLILNNIGIANIGDATGIRPSSANGNLYVSLHTADPGEAGTQTTSETAYTGYARVAVARNPSSPEWDVSGDGVATNINLIAFPACTGGSSTVTHGAIGVSSSGAGKILYKGALAASLAVSSGITPEIDPGDLAVTEA